MTKQSTVSVSRSLFAAAYDYEIEVANILLDLKNLIRQSERQLELRGFSFSWGCKRRRSNSYRGFSSSVVSPPPTTAAGADVNSRSPSPPPPPPVHPELPAVPRVKSEVLSPATPLSFSPSESDEKPIISSRKHSKKRVNFMIFNEKNSKKVFFFFKEKKKQRLTNPKLCFFLQKKKRLIFVRRNYNSWISCYFFCVLFWTCRLERNG